MSARKKFCLIGQVLVDVTLTNQSENKLRLGGAMHAARGLWALGIDYTLAYISPAYLVPLIEDFSSKTGASKSFHIGEVTGSPNIILISEATEAGSQGYELLLRESAQNEINIDRLNEVIKSDEYSDILILPGGFNLEIILNALSETDSRIYIDAAYDVSNITNFQQLGRSFESIILSTSSNLFLDDFAGNTESLSKNIFDKGLAETFLFKENRGGARLFHKDGTLKNIGAQVRKIVHSVGVGDVYDVVFAALRHEHSDEEALAYASFISAEYASTTYPDDFKQAVENTLKISPVEIVKLKGIILPWEERKEINIYIAAPDFDYMNQNPIIETFEALKYHNFNPVRPIQENGQIKPEDSIERRFEVFNKDMDLLNKSNMLVAVIIDNDPGTFIEIGLASEKGLPVIVYDPYKIASNLVLQQLPNLVTSSLDQVIASVFRFASMIVNEEI